MIYLLVWLYLWAGMTTVWLMWQIESIGDSLDFKFSKRLRDNFVATLGMIAIWPLFIPVWAYTELRIRHGMKVDDCP